MGYDFSLFPTLISPFTLLVFLSSSSAYSSSTSSPQCIMYFCYLYNIVHLSFLFPYLLFYTSFLLLITFVITCISMSVFTSFSSTQNPVVNCSSNIFAIFFLFILIYVSSTTYFFIVRFYDLFQTGQCGVIWILQMFRESRQKVLCCVNMLTPFTLTGDLSGDFEGGKKVRLFLLVSSLEDFFLMITFYIYIYISNLYDWHWICSRYFLEWFWWHILQVQFICNVLK